MKSCNDRFRAARMSPLGALAVSPMTAVRAEAEQLLQRCPSYAFVSIPADLSIPLPLLVTSSRQSPSNCAAV